MDEDQDQSGWQLTESDPGVFSELLKNLHVPYIVDDLYSLDPNELSALQPIHAFIFLFKWITDPTSGPAGTPDPEFPGFFANQVVNNACATLAVLNALGNIPELPSTFQGSESPLQELISFTTGMDPADRGYAVVSVDWLREAHNSLSPPTVLSLEGLLPPGEKEEAYHFIVYLPVAGSVYELDGLQRAAIRHGACDASNWMDVARDVINARIATYPEGAVSSAF
jgi:ubiquitin carboxyl-terminal hydrolase L5